MSVKDTNPEKILVSTEFLKQATLDNTSLKDTQKETDNSKNIILTLLGGFLSSLLTLLSSWNSWSLAHRYVTITICLVYTILLIWFGVKHLQAKKKLSSMSVRNQDVGITIIEQAKDKIKYTALLIVCYQKAGTGEVTFMTEKPGNYLIHCEMTPDKSINEQNKSLINYLVQTYNIHKNTIKEIVPLSSEPFFSIKPIHGEVVQNGFVFFHIRLKKSAKQQLVNHRNVEWKTIQEMEAMPELMGRNQDIVMALNEYKIKFTDSFEDSYGPIHVIWNITQKCSYNCAICATKDVNRKELSTEDKLRVLNNLLSAKERISTLDFAGGDPMCDSGIRTIIMNAVISLGEEHISVTTTGKGIQAIMTSSEEEMARLLYKCEITIDASHDNLANKEKNSAFARRSPDYNSHNFNQIKNIPESVQKLIINIPILDDDLSDDEIDALRNKVYQIKQSNPDILVEAQIIRLMPVGAFLENYSPLEYANYYPISIAKKIMARIKQLDVTCRYHCSLRVLSDVDGSDPHCNMLERKIGVDCNGNVFACTWGAYLHIPDEQDIASNPFYLGNLVSTNLRSILEGQGKTQAYNRIMKDVSNRRKKPYCEAVSWVFCDKDIGSNHDPLSNKNTASRH